MNVVSHLADAPIFQRGVGHGSPFGYAVAERFFDEDIFSRLECAHGRDCVPVIRSHYGDSLDFLVLQQPAEIAKASRLTTTYFLDLGNRAV